MEKNVGDYEAIARGVMGAAAMAIGISQRSLVWLGLSALTFLSAATRVCPINSLTGRNTYTGPGEEREPLRAVPTLH